MNKFWNWARDANDGSRTLYLSGTIAEESWFDDDVTPALFKSELQSGSGDITVWINSPGGDCVAASQIYTMLMDYPGHVTIKIDGLAASAASVVAMAGTQVLMAPTAMMMVHNPLTVAIGDSEEMQKLSHLMDAETWMNAKKAVELGFADGILTDEKTSAADAVSYAFSRRAVTNSLLSKLPHPKNEHLQSVEPLYQRLQLLQH